MSNLASLKLVTSKKPRSISPVLHCRNKLSTKLWEQIQFAKTQQEGKPFAPLKYRTVVDRETGLRRQVEMPKRVKPWWWVSQEGKVCVSVKYGSYTIELARGKPSVEVASASDLIEAGNY